MASYVDRICQGGKPADLPIERPTTFELVLNVANLERLSIRLNQLSGVSPVNRRAPTRVLMLLILER